MSTRPVQWPGDDESKPAPGRLIAFKRWSIRSSCRTVRTASPIADARPWLVDNHLLAPHAELTDADLDLVRGVREALRALLVQNAGGPTPTDAAWPRCGDRGRRHGPRDLGDDGEVRLTATGDSVRDRLVDLLADRSRRPARRHLDAAQGLR